MAFKLHLNLRPLLQVSRNLAVALPYLDTFVIVKNMFGWLPRALSKQIIIFAVSMVSKQMIT